jgi:Rrf2 family protein
VHISAKADYALRVLLTLVAAEGTSPVKPVKAESLAVANELPVKFVENILVNLRRAGLVSSHRGIEGGYRLARPASEITAAEVMRAVDGPLADVRGLRPEAAEYTGPAEHLRDVWVAVRASLRMVLEQVTLADIVSGHLPAPVAELCANPEAWRPH